jgi:hypothetical protein
MRDESWSPDSGVWSVSLPGQILSLEMPSADEVRALVRVKRKWWQLWRTKYRDVWIHETRAPTASMGRDAA